MAFFLYILLSTYTFPGGSAVNETAINLGDHLPGRRHIFDPWARKLPLPEKEMATYSSILAWKSHGQWSLVGYSPWSRKRVGHNLATKPLPSTYFLRNVSYCLSPFVTSVTVISASYQETRVSTCAFSAAQFWRSHGHFEY